MTPLEVACEALEAQLGLALGDMFWKLEHNAGPNSTADCAALAAHYGRALLALRGVINADGGLNCIELAEEVKR